MSIVDVNQTSGAATRRSSVVWPQSFLALCGFFRHKGQT
jgi:hypothetical protein